MPLFYGVASIRTINLSINKPFGLYTFISVFGPLKNLLNVVENFLPLARINFEQMAGNLMRDTLELKIPRTIKGGRLTSN